MKLWVWWLAAVLAGCSGDPVRQPPTNIDTTQIAARIAAFDTWRADGRVAIQRGDEGWSAALRWQRQSQTFQLRLIAPLGRGTYQLSGDDREVALVIPDGRRFIAEDPEALMLEHLGWSIPVTGAHYWLRGLVAPGEPATQVRRDESGLLRDLQQAGWRISILRHTEVDDLAMPSKLFLHYRDLKVRIVVTRWQLGSV